MSGSVVADNWSLQNIAELLTTGVDDGNATAISVDKTADIHVYEPLPQALVSFEALFDLLTDIVLQDQILVDTDFTSTWKKLSSELQNIADANVIRPYRFLAQAENLAGPRNEFVDRLCLTKSMRLAHEINSKQWAETRSTPDNVLSTTLWGGAGMLARAFISEKGYTPHPLRRRLFQQAGIVLTDEDATVRLIHAMQEKRANFSQSRLGNDMLYSLRINLPPLPILVIRESSNAAQLLPIALQMRSEYQGLRDWLGEYQQALISADSARPQKFEKTLRSISTYIDSFAGRSDSNAPTFTAGFSAFKIAFKGHPVESLKNQFGVRATVNRLILAGSGYAELKKLLGFFGQRHGAIAVKLIEHFGMEKTFSQRK